MEDIFRRKNWVKLNRPNRTTSNTKLLARVQPDIRNKIPLPPWNKFHLPRYRYPGGLVPPRFFCEATTNFVDATDWKRTRGRRRDRKEGMASLYRSSDSFANKKGEKKSGTKVAASKNGGLFPEKVSSFFSGERRFHAGTAIEKSRGGERCNTDEYTV